MAKLKNTQIEKIVNEAYNLMTGKTEVPTAIDLKDFCDNGSKSIGEENREKFTGALIGVCTKNWFTDTSYRSEYNDPFFVDTEQFGAIMQVISVNIPNAISNSAWNDFVSGETKVGQYTVYLPIVDTLYYTKSTSWALPIDITGEQWDTAFRSASDLSSFVSYVFMCLENAILQHMEDMNALNRNNFIANKIKAQTDNVKGIHVVDLVKEFVDETGRTQAMTVAQALNSREFLAFASGKITEFISYFKKQTSLFNTEGKVRFTPNERIVLQLLDRFVKRMETLAYSDTFHEEYIALPNHSTVPWWQNSGDLSFNDVSSINITNGTTPTSEPIVVCNRSGIVGLLADSWAIMHTIRSKRVASQHFNIENITHYEYQHRDSYMNNLTLNAVVFVMNDYTGV